MASCNNFCKTTDGENAVKSLEQYINLNGIPKFVRTDKATSFTGRTFRGFCKNCHIKLIYGTPYIHTPTWLVERGVRTLKETLLANIKAGENPSEALDTALDVMRKTPHTRLKKSAFELHYGREPNTESSNMLNIDKMKEITKNSFSAKPDTLQVYSFNGASGVSDQLPMKQKKGAKGGSNYPFTFFEKKKPKPKFYSAYFDKPQKAILGSKNTVTTLENRVLHREHMSKPISEFTLEPNNRGIGPRGPDGRFIKSPKLRRYLDSDSDSEDHKSSNGYHCSNQQNTNNTGPDTEKDWRIWKRTTETNPEQTELWFTGGLTHTIKTKKHMDPLTITAEYLTDSEIDRITEDAKMT